MKICITCKINKPMSDFYPKNGRRTGQSKCIECMKDYQRQHYKENRTRYIQVNKQHKFARELFVYQYLLAHPCSCGESDPAALDFDHHSNKKFNMFRAYQYGIETIKLEIAKCEVRCANCHRKKTAKEQGWYTKFKMVGPVGLEPTTYSLKGCSSTS